MKAVVGILDYGMGNLHSVAKAMEAAGSHIKISGSKRVLSTCDGLLVPGVGHFGAAMTSLAKAKLDDFIRAWITEDKPYLGICLGLQLLFERSDEDPRTPGLGALRGEVTAFDSRHLNAQGLKIPHMGWNRLVQTKKVGPLKNLKEGSYAYFVHSYYPTPSEDLVVAQTDYGIRFASAVRKGNLFASQFHPEKSARTGLAILKNFTRALNKRGGLHDDHPGR
jgi:glutamine amidotransferase